MTIKQISIFLENKPDSLSKLTKVLADKKIINTFLCSSPKKIVETIINLYNKLLEI